ncbi:ankyrin repeat domain-containing protein [Serratia marcescens]|uniref:ankyrin repeat domain-containing protein n=1 Tax=Serratia marcescens TaxID=615 RepID=UPI003C6F9058
MYYGRQQTKLYFAIWKLNGSEKLQAIKYFISCGEDIHERDKNELTPLHQAVGCGDVEAVKLLLTLGANPNAMTYMEEHRCSIPLSALSQWSSVR